jgi:ketosteroid isomerase-like protein
MRSTGLKSIAVLVTLSAAAMVLPAASSPGRQASPEDALTSLIEAERAFARISEERGVREAFLEYLAARSIVFRPRPVEGRPVYEKMAPDNPTLLTWEPETAEISTAADLGYTSGPYEVRKSRDENEPSGYGHYVTIWKKQPDKAWKVILDIGISHDRPEPGPEGAVVRIFPSSAIPAVPGEPDAPEAAGELVDADREFSRKAGLWGYLVALKDQGTDDVRVYRPGNFPVAGRERIKEVLALDFGRTTVENLGAGAARSNDLGYTYGTFTITGISGEAATSSYLKIWRRAPSAGWMICLDIALPISPS